MPEQSEDRLGQGDDDGDGAEQSETQDQSEADADPAGFRTLVLGQLVGEDRDEDQVVDAEDDFHHDKGREGHEGGRVGQPFKAHERFLWAPVLGNGGSPLA